MSEVLQACQGATAKYCGLMAPDFGPGSGLTQGCGESARTIWSVFQAMFNCKQLHLLIELV